MAWPACCFLAATGSSQGGRELADLYATRRADAEGLICGRKAIEEKYVNLFQQWHPSDIACTIDQVSAIGNVSWNSGG
jgi:hypothetical protein